MGNVNQVAIQALEDGAIVKIVLYRGIVTQQRDGMEIGRQRADLGDLFRRPNQKIFTLSIQTAQRADDIAGICTDAELSQAPYIDRDSHREI
jgi:hypothetical protein